MFLTTINPHTNGLINLFSDQVNNLLANGYTMSDVMNLFKQIPSCYNRNNIFSNDLFINYAMHLELMDIVSLCSVDKHARMVLDNQQLWEYKIKQCTNYFIPGYNGLNYKKALHANKLTSMYMNRTITLKFNATDNLSLFISCVSYIPGKYDTQKVDIFNAGDGYHMNLRVAWSNKTKVFKSSKLSFINIKKFMFITFFKFPNIICRTY